MMFYTHLVFGLLSGFMFLNYFNNKILFLIFVILGALLPDIDEVDSKIGRRLKPLSWFINLLFKHRGIFHSIFPVLLMYISLVYFLKLKLIGFGLIIGYSSHLIADSLTVLGINFLNPFLNLRINGFIKTGSLLEKILFVLLIILSIFKVKDMFFKLF